MALAQRRRMIWTISTLPNAAPPTNALTALNRSPTTTATARPNIRRPDHRPSSRVTIHMITSVERISGVLLQVLADQSRRPTAEGTINAAIPASTAAILANATEGQGRERT